MSKTENIYAFIDSQNLNLGVRDLRWRLDFKKFRVFLGDKYHVKKAYLFIGYVEENQSLYRKLQKFGYVLIFKPTLIYKNKKAKHIKGNVDAELVLHTMIHFDEYDKAIIITGDGDFHCLIDYLKKHNKLKKVITPNSKYSSLLRKFGKDVVCINQFKNKVQRI